LLAKLIPPGQRLITIFPRHRVTRRPDKNWGEDKFRELISILQKEYPQYKIALIGLPHLAYFESGVPEGCVDLIHIDNEQNRMEYEIAAVSQSVLAIGGVSGTTLFSLLCGCHSLIWGHGASYRQLVNEENPLDTPFIYYPEIQPTVDEIMQYVRWRFDVKKIPLKLEMKKNTKLGILSITPQFILESKRLAQLKKTIMGER
jgi:hypothetical protein